MPPYVLTTVHLDGVQHHVAEYLGLEEALVERDRRRDHVAGVAPLYLVHDADDEEKGYFDWMHLDDLEDSAASLSAEAGRSASPEFATDDAEPSLGGPWEEFAKAYIRAQDALHHLDLCLANAKARGTA